MDVTLWGMFTEVKLLQPEKAAAPIDVTLLGMLTEVKPLQTLKAPPPIDVTVYDIPSIVIVIGILMEPEYLRVF